VALPALPPETGEEVEARCRAWLDTNFHQFEEAGAVFQLYRMAEDFWNPIKAASPRYVSWHVRKDGLNVTSLPYTAALTPEAARHALREYLAEHAFECHGGPWDGQHVGAQGEQFRPDVQVVETVLDGALPMKRPAPGVYVRQSGTYIWRPDPGKETA
jgi:hypothetical protein